MRFRLHVYIRAMADLFLSFLSSFLAHQQPAHFATGRRITRLSGSATDVDDDGDARRLPCLH